MATVASASVAAAMSNRGSFRTQARRIVRRGRPRHQRVGRRPGDLHGSCSNSPPRGGGIAADFDWRIPDK